MSEEADSEAAEHPQDPDGIAVAHAAVVFAQRGVQALMQTAFHAPVLTGGVQPLRRSQAGGFATGHQPDRLGAMRADVAVQLRDLSHMREAHLLRGGGPAMQLSALPPAAIAFLSPRLGWRVRLREKKRPGSRPGAPRRFVGSLFGCP